MSTWSPFQVGMIKKLLSLALLLGGTTAMAQADNRYCQPVDTPDFGAAKDVRGVNLGGSSYVGIVDSYFNDFHCIAKTGSCTDAQAIVGGNSNVPAGVYKIVNNYLEGAAENIMFGGAAASQIPLASRFGTTTC
jgi:hypothetical protein